MTSVLPAALLSTDVFFTPSSYPKTLLARAEFRKWIFPFLISKVWTVSSFVCPNYGALKLRVAGRHFLKSYFM